jgi:hypothetical protein
MSLHCNLINCPCAVLIFGTKPFLLLQISQLFGAARILVLNAVILFFLKYKDEIGLFDTLEILPSDKFSSYDLRFSPFGNCFSQALENVKCYSEVNGIIYESDPLNSTPWTNMLTCSILMNKISSKSNVYIGWKSNGERLSKKLIVTTVKKTFAQTKDFTYAYLNQPFNVTIQTTESYPLEVQKYLFCVIKPLNDNETLLFKAELTGTENEYFCAFSGGNGTFINSGGIVYSVLLGYVRGSQSEVLVSYPSLVVTVGKFLLRFTCRFVKQHHGSKSNCLKNYFQKHFGCLSTCETNIGKFDLQRFGGIVKI